jgi:hypothetical protein
MSNILAQLNTAARAKDLDVELVVADGKPLGEKGRERREIMGLRIMRRDKPKGPPVEEQACTLATIESAAADLLLAIR